MFDPGSATLTSCRAASVVRSRYAFQTTPGLPARPFLLGFSNSLLVIASDAMRPRFVPISSLRTQRNRRRTTATFRPELGFREKPVVARLFTDPVLYSFVGLEASRIISERADIRADNQKNTANLTSSLLQHAELTFRTADALLIAAVFSLEHGAFEPEDQRRLKDLFVEEVQHSSQFVSLAVINRNGALVLTSVAGDDSASGQGMSNLSDREHFIYHQTHTDRDLHIGPPVRALTTGEWIIPVTWRFDRPDGSFAGVVVAAINPQYFQTLYERFDIGKPDSARSTE
jgi:hypothetical protein